MVPHGVAGQHSRDTGNVDDGGMCQAGVAHEAGVGACVVIPARKARPGDGHTPASTRVTQVHDRTCAHALEARFSLPADSSGAAERRKSTVPGRLATAAATRDSRASPAGSRAHSWPPFVVKGDDDAMGQPVSAHEALPRRQPRMPRSAAGGSLRRAVGESREPPTGSEPPAGDPGRGGAAESSAAGEAAHEVDTLLQQMPQMEDVLEASAATARGVERMSGLMALPAGGSAGTDDRPRLAWEAAAGSDEEGGTEWDGSGEDRSDELPIPGTPRLLLLFVMPLENRESKQECMHTCGRHVAFWVWCVKGGCCSDCCTRNWDAVLAAGRGTGLCSGPLAARDPGAT